VTDGFDPVTHNRAAWDREVENDNEWTRPVGPDVIARARAGDWSVVLVGYQPVPRDWFPAALTGVALLGLASGGGQQGPVLAAAGAAVTVFDNSPRQLGRDEEVAARDGLALRTVLGDMRDLSAFAGASFDVVFNPVSNVFCPDLVRQRHFVMGRVRWRVCADSGFGGLGLGDAGASWTSAGCR
jgi:SAM-dependent methyltransferase